MATKQQQHKDIDMQTEDTLLDVEHREGGIWRRAVVMVGRGWAHREETGSGTRCVYGERERPKHFKSNPKQ